MNVFCDLYRASSTVRIVKSRTLHGAEHVTWELTPSVNFSVRSAEPLGSDIIALVHHAICFSELPCKLMSFMNNHRFHVPH
jgi:hypothetical protein